MDATQTALLADINDHLDSTVGIVTEALTEHGQEFAVSALGIAILLMDPAQLADLAFGATLRLAELEVANSE